MKAVRVHAPGGPEILRLPDVPEPVPDPGQALIRAAGKFLGVALLLCAGSASAAAQTPPREGDFVIRNFRFRSGESLPELKLHVVTLGRPGRDARGAVDNAVLVLHGTGGSGRQFLARQFADVLYAAGAPLDTTRTWVILPDGIGHGQSSKPSNGAHARFPHYGYDDMVEAQYRLVTEYLGIKHLLW
jgi:homoserine O-acetyltransferase